VNAIAFLHPVMREDIASILKPTGGQVTSTFRSIEEQRVLRRNFELGRAKFPAEKPGHSTHHTGLAVDFVVPQGSRSPEQYELGRYWKSLGGWWSPNDPIHFEHPDARAALAQGLTRPRWWL